MTKHQQTRTRHLTTLAALATIAALAATPACDQVYTKKEVLLWAIELQLPTDQPPPARLTLTLHISQHDATATGLPTEMSFRGGAGEPTRRASGATKWVDYQGTEKSWCFRDPLTLHNSTANTTTELAPAGTCTHTRERPVFATPPGAFPPP